MLFSNADSPRSCCTRFNARRNAWDSKYRKNHAGDWNLYLGNPGYGGYPLPGSGKYIDPEPHICSESPCLFNVSKDTVSEQNSMAADHPDVYRN